MPRQLLGGILAASVAALAGTANAAVVQWTVEDGGNGHYYDIIVTPLQSWLTSKAQAESMGGYLASIRSVEENNWLWNTFNIGGTTAYWSQIGPWPNYDGPVFGAYRNAANQWSWVSGEEWGWSNFNWNSHSGEGCAQFIARSSSWDDIGVNGGNSSGGNVAFIVEWNSNPVPAPATLAVALAATGLRRRRTR